ncbi:hypothetical protein [Alicyclobacillus sp. SO9]|uniref:hypothetical protein n=1 Tax=Alicyclobacillus sp. SO9 TaxID=2665646 RepID=UPI0018E88129|nr:hypothetical protein [Alicyclobacillus sp. SO9]QQE78366.1 hypothetical protein GI364_21225 [Alicyclobacillus sp. SO9]
MAIEIQIDATKLDVEVHETDGTVAGRPWMIVGANLVTGHLAYCALTLDEPSGKAIIDMLESWLSSDGDRGSRNHVVHALMGMPNKIKLDRSLCTPELQLYAARNQIELSILSLSRQKGCTEQIFHSFEFKHFPPGSPKSRNDAQRLSVSWPEVLNICQRICYRGEEL